MSDLESLRVPVFCPICEEFMKGSQSVRTYYDWGCCMHCHVEFVEDREERWRSGWRPSRDEVVAKRGGRIWDAGVAAKIDRQIMADLPDEAKLSKG